MKDCSPPCFGSEEDTNGDTVCRVLRIGIGLVDSELLPPN